LPAGPKLGTDDLDKHLSQDANLNYNTISVKKYYEARSSQSWFIFLQTLMGSMWKKSTQDANQGSLSFATPEM
jgi:hypothetical protein